MSNRAHIVIKIEEDQCPVFNLWHDEILMNELSDELYNTLNSDGCGLATLEESTLEEAKKNIIALEVPNDKQLEKKQAIHSLNRLIKAAQSNFGEVIVDCY